MNLNTHKLDPDQNPMDIPSSEEIHELKSLYGGGIADIVTGQHNAILELSKKAGEMCAEPDGDDIHAFMHAQYATGHVRDLIIKQARKIVALSKQTATPIAAAYYQRLNKSY
ncbi:MAG: hypothetical protein LBH31_01575 [Burkholderiaceae bacterium]|jgi:hypothetical protein|nr:hypothetical protein [Burkholderiaceae bacterium]